MGTNTTSWDLTAHTSALREFKNIPDTEESNLKEIAREASEMPQPSSHTNIGTLREAGGLLRLKTGKYRALASLNKPEFQILLVAHREGCYERIQEAQERQGD
jgi:mRNA-degrading endonuclease RelE of RelBE toxin-antitoxin system